MIKKFHKSKRKRIEILTNNIICPYTCVHTHANAGIKIVNKVF